MTSPAICHLAMRISLPPDVFVGTLFPTRAGFAPLPADCVTMRVTPPDRPVGRIDTVPPDTVAACRIFRAPG